MNNLRRLQFISLLLVALGLRPLLVEGQQAYGPQPQIASLRPTHLLWQRTSPTPEQPDGPVLYQLLFSASGTPGAIAAFDTNPRHLINSPITVSGGNVVIGGGNGLSINGTSGIITFANGQTFPGTGVNSIGAGNSFITIGGTAANPTVGLNTAGTDARYLTLGGGTMTGNITFAAGQTFPGTGNGSVTAVSGTAPVTVANPTTTPSISIAPGGIGNALLANPFVTVTPGQGLAGGGSVSLGSNVTLSNTGLLGVTALGPLSATSGQNPVISLSGVIPVANGGTGSGTLSFVDLTSNQTIAGNKTFAGNATFNSGTQWPTTGTATPSAGFSSTTQELTASSFNGNIGGPVLQNFVWQAEPVANGAANASGSLNLLFAAGANTPTETGLSIASNGQVNFAAGQTFPGTGTVTSISGNAPITVANPTTTPNIGIAAGGIDNTLLANPSVSINAGGGLVGGGALALGGTLSLSTNATPNNTASTIVSRDGSGSLAAGTITLSNTLALPSTTSSSAGVITLGGTPFLHNFGTNNTFVGASAGNMSMTGTGSNSALGVNALNANTTGSFNSAFGWQSLQSSTTACCNSAFGSQSLQFNNTGAFNDGFGRGALLNNTTGSHNAAFGDTALLNNTTASGNAAFGDSALRLNTIGTGNSAFGINALLSNNDPNNASNASNNSAFGSNALTSNTTASFNSAFGALALQANTTGHDNAAFGASALRRNSTTNFNSAFGSGALQTNTAEGNSAFGSGALQFNTTSSGNNAFGWLALFANTTGSNNAAFGSGALEINSTGFSNSAFGSNALTSSTTGFQNSAFGFNALEADINGFNNTAIGEGALEQVTAGNFNIGIGVGGGFNHTGSDSNNIDIGNIGVAGDSNAIRIGNGSHTAAFITGIFGTTSGSGAQVFVNGFGKLGTTPSSQRYKEGITDLGKESDVLMKLRPVAFYYKPELDSTHTKQYGLVAEEVAQVAPGLVVFDDDGRPQMVRYHFVNAMLLNEVQKQRRLIEEQQRRISVQEDEIKIQQSKSDEQQKQISAQQQQIAYLNAALKKQQASQQAQIILLQKQFQFLRILLRRHDTFPTRSIGENYQSLFHK